MSCAICNKKFIKTTTHEEYVIERQKMNEILDKFIDDNYINEKDEDLCWDVIFQYEALLLFPGQNNQKCSNEKCNAEICSYCYNKKNILSNNSVCEYELKNIIPFSNITYCSLCKINFSALHYK
jgi:hypothetical protein